MNTQHNISARMHKGYWTIFSNGTGLMSFKTMEECLTALDAIR